MVGHLKGMNNLNLENLNKTNWYVVKARPNTEKKVHERLLNNNFTSYLPIYSTVRQWSDRKKKVSLPLIPSVVFVNCEITDLPKLFLIPGINGILNYLGKPAVVKDLEIENLRILLNEWSDDSIAPCDEFLEEGTSIEVIQGPFKGLIATSISLNGKNRVVVKIESLGSNFLVNVPKSFVKKIV